MISSHPASRLIALALAFAIVFTLRTIAAADDGIPPLKPVPFRPWQIVWQCNDVTVTVTSNAPGDVEYILSGTLWMQNRFTWIKDNLYFNGRPCMPLQPARLP
jgi:hypothetical protein